ncbi:hypothetical protein L604_002200000440 [Bacillus subtilis J27]|nr:hypothetical protein L604_002200000440 [Bacillus subtilis J27]
MKEEIIERFTTYVKVDTQSDESVDTCPSTPGQLTLGNMLVDELKSIGMQDAAIDENGYVMATMSWQLFPPILKKTCRQSAFSLTSTPLQTLPAKT